MRLIDTQINKLKDVVMFSSHTCNQKTVVESFCDVDYGDLWFSGNNSHD